MQIVKPTFENPFECGPQTMDEFQKHWNSTIKQNFQIVQGMLIYGLGPQLYGSNKYDNK